MALQKKAKQRAAPPHNYLEEMWCKGSVVVCVGGKETVTREECDRLATAQCSRNNQRVVELTGRERLAGELSVSPSEK